MEILFLLLIIAVLCEFFLRPRFDYVVDTENNEGWVVLWYGREIRTVVKLFKYISQN